MIGLHQLRTSLLIPKLCVQNTVPKNTFWAWLTFMFNRVSKSRIEQLGPDRACAEWLMRNGAFIRWKGHSRFVSHYNQLPKDQDMGKFYLQEVNATDASISHHGFPHFRDCQYVESLRLERCTYLEDSALSQLALVKGSLETLAIISCGNITDRGITSLSKLLKLKTLEMGDLIEVEDIKKCVKELQAALPNCNITFSEPL